MKSLDLFESTNDFKPLAARMRPATLDQYLGQGHLTGEGKPLNRLLEHGRIHSMILWGPAGTGKTTLAEMIANHCNAHIERISAVTSGVKDIRSAIDNAKAVATQQGIQTLLFVDEVHRFNKSQQDAFLPFVEDGTVVFIGATTENPAFELNSALLSRARVYRLTPLDKEALAQIAQSALRNDVILRAQSLEIDDKALEILIDCAKGDGRTLLNMLELASDFAVSGKINVDAVLNAAGEKVANYDKNGDQFYDLISAFHKSVRGSDPDAAVYWYARMLVAGCDPLYVARRLLAIVSEDIGNADPRAMQIALNAWDIFHRVGPAEGERAIAQAAIYCASAAKSNAVYQAFNQAKVLASETGDVGVPAHLCNAPTAIHKAMGHGEDYRYAHNEPHHFAAGECYFPDALKDTQLYSPTDNGLEKQIGEKLRQLNQLNQQSKQQRYTR